MVSCVSLAFYGNGMSDTYSLIETATLDCGLTQSSFKFPSDDFLIHPSLCLYNWSFNCHFGNCTSTFFCDCFEPNLSIFKSLGKINGRYIFSQLHQLLLYCEVSIQSSSTVLKLVLAPLD